MHDSEPTNRVTHALAAHGLKTKVVRMQASTRTAQDAANAVGCELAQIVKSLVLVTDHERYLLALISGPKRVSTTKLESLFDIPFSMAKAKDAERVTGFAVGGVPPVGHVSSLDLIMDQTLLQQPNVWAAAGTADTLFPIAPQDVIAITGAHVADITE